MSRRSTVSNSTLVPALKVLSTTLPVITFFILVRTNAPPLPGFTCWKSMIVQRLPSRLSTEPFLMSFEVATIFLALIVFEGTASKGRRQV